MTKKTKILIAIAFLFFLIPFVFYFSIFNSGFSFNDTSWSNFGSFIGGLGATIFSFASFVLLVINFNLEKENYLKLEIDKKTQEETEMFFRFLDYFYLCKERLYCITPKETIKGPAVINFYNAQRNGFCKDNVKLVSNYNNDIRKFIENEPDLKTHFYSYIIANEAVEIFITVCEQIVYNLNNTKYIDPKKYMQLFVSSLTPQDKMVLVYKNIEIVHNIEKQNITVLADKELNNHKKILSQANSFLGKIEEKFS